MPQSDSRGGVGLPSGAAQCASQPEASVGLLFPVEAETGLRCLSYVVVREPAPEARPLGPVGRP